VLFGWSAACCLLFNVSCTYHYLFFVDDGTIKDLPTEGKNKMYRRLYGKNIDHRQATADAEIQGAGIYSMPALRTSTLCSSQISALPYLLPRACLQGANSRREKGKLVRTGFA
jgi:hypothetical protein